MKSHFHLSFFIRYWVYLRELGNKSCENVTLKGVWVGNFTAQHRSSIFYWGFFHHLIRVTSVTCDLSLYQWKSMFILCIDKWNESEKRFPKIHTWYARNPVLFAPNCRKNCRNGYEDTIYLIFLYIRLKIMKFKVNKLQKVWNV